MAGKKAKSEISDNALVQKARPFFNLWQCGYTLFDFKVFDLYLGSINSHKPETKIVTFTKNDFTRILGVKQKITPQQLDDRLRVLRAKEITIDTNSKYPIRTSLFASTYVDTTTQPYYTVRLEVSQQLLDLVFNIDKQNGIGYFKYRLKNTLKINSVYSYLMFNFLQSKAYREAGNILATTFTADIDYLKKILNCENDETYAEFKHFNNLVLKKCHKEITGKTELQYIYNTIKSGRKVIAIEFIIEPFTFARIEEQPEQQTIQQIKVPELMQKPDAVLNEQETQQQQSELDYLTANQCKSLLSEISLKYDEYTDNQCKKKLKALYYACVDRCKNKNNLFMYIKSTLDNETIPQPQAKRKAVSDAEDSEYNEMYDIFINSFVKPDAEE